MEISYLQVKKIFDTLPVGYYIGRDVQRELSNDSKESFYDPMNDKICISYSFIKEGLKETDEKNIENDVRTLLYHEVSHAFLTPKYLMSRFSECFPRSEYSISSNIVINIFFITSPILFVLLYLLLKQHKISCCIYMQQPYLLYNKIFIFCEYPKCRFLQFRLLAPARWVTAIYPLSSTGCRPTQNAWQLIVRTDVA